MKRVMDVRFLADLEAWADEAKGKRGTRGPSVAALRLGRGDATLKATVSQCEQCVDGWASWEADGSDPTQIKGYNYSGPCPTCGPLHVQADLLNGVGLPLEPWGATFATFERRRPGDTPDAHGARLAALNAAQRFVYDVVDAGSRWADCKGIALAGGPGRGKTHLLAALGFQLSVELGTVGRKVRIRYVDFGDLMRRAKGSISNGGASSSKLIREVAEAQILLLDELGGGRATDWEQDVAEEVLRHRYKNRLPTCFATNCSLGENPDAGDQLALVNRIGRLAYSRLKSLVRPPTTLLGEDQRG